MGKYSNAPNAILDPALRFNVNFPPIPYGQAFKYINAIERTSGNTSTTHPCIITWGKLVKCMRRFPHSFSNKCIADSNRHKQCLTTHKNWKEPSFMNSFTILNLFQMFHMKFNKKYKFRSVEQQGSGSFTEFSRTSKTISR